MITVDALARYLAALPERHDAAEALRRQEEATARAWEAGRQEAADPGDPLAASAGDAPGSGEHAAQLQ